jgi:hypothetical protein
MDALQQTYGWQINYEDAQYQSPPDYKEVPAPQYMTAKAGTTIRIPSGGNFQVTVPLKNSSDAAPDEQMILQTIVDAYNKSDNPGRFDIRKNLDGSFEVVGTSIRDGRTAVKKQPLMDTAITIPKKQRTELQAVELICSAVSQKSHVEVSLGVYPRTIMVASQTSVGGSKASARELLADALSSATRKISWRLVYDPDAKNYFLNLTAVPVLSLPQK